MKHYRVMKSSLALVAAGLLASAGWSASAADFSFRRLLDLRWRRDAAPEADAGTVATPQEITLVRRANRMPGAALTVRAFVDGVAKLGGWLGRKGDGPPGWQSLWRGYQRLADMLLGLELLAGADPPVCYPS